MFRISNDWEVSINIFLFRNQMGQKALIPKQTKVWVCLWKEELSCLEFGPIFDLQKDGILLICEIVFCNYKKLMCFFCSVNFLSNLLNSS